MIRSARRHLSKQRRTVGLLCSGVFLLTVSCPGTQGARGAGRSAIQIKGSDTMVNVVQAWAEAYGAVDSSVVVEVSGGGSGVGIAALVKGAVDIATASRDMKPQEAQEARQNTGREPVEFTVGYDALAIFVHKDNPLSRITREQLAQIYVEGGAVTRWSQLGVTIPGVKDDRIVRMSRQSSSGTYAFFRERVLDKRDFKLGSLDMNGSKEVVELVGSTRTAVGYSGMGYATPSVKMLAYVAKPGDTAVAPTVANTTGGRYGLARSLHFYTLGEPRGAVKAFIDWTLSTQGQGILTESGYVPAAIEPSTE